MAHATDKEIGARRQERGANDEYGKIGFRHSCFVIFLPAPCLVVFALLSFAVSGCRTAHYRGATLPAQLRIPEAIRTTDLNLARMVGPGTGTNQIGPGDLLEITVASGRNEEENLPFRARVTEEGAVDAPPIGPVMIAGLEPAAAERRIEEAAIDRGIFVRPSVTLKVEEPAVNRVTVLGAVKEPGVVELPRGSSDLARALAAAGGLSEEASSKVDILRHSEPAFFADVRPPESSPDGVRLASFDASGSEVASENVSGPPRRGTSDGPQAVRIDLAKAATTSSTNYTLGDRDVVMVLPKEPRFIHVTGLVNNSNQFEIPHDQDVRVLDAIAMAGGVSSPVADKVYVVRNLPDMPEPAVIQVSIATALRNGNENLRLGPGDLVSVERTMSTVAVDSIMTMFRVGFNVGGGIVAF